MDDECRIWEELARLHAELEQVQASPQECLPEYGYSPKEEVISLIEDDIRRMEEAIEAERQDIFYGEGELEEERRRLCLSQGLSRWC